MSDDNTVIEGQEPEGNAEEFKVDDLPDEAQKLIRQLRRENAKHRTEKQAAKAELDEYNTWKDSQKSELQKAADRAEKAEKELAKARTESRQITAAKKAGLDLDLAERVRGESDEEMLEDAKALALLFHGEKKDSKTTARDFSGGTAGKGAVTQKGTADEGKAWFDNWVNGGYKSR